MYLPYERLPNPTTRFEVYEELAQGVNAKVFRALEIETGRVVALKIQHYDPEHQISIEEEYRTLRDNSQHPNLPQFFGVYRLPKHHGPDEIWFALEYCDGGSAAELLTRMQRKGRRFTEDVLSYIIRSVGLAALELNRNHVLHRDIKGDNILFKQDGSVKLCDFGLSRQVDSTFDKCGTRVGSPCWMAPELVKALEAQEPEISSRVDVWALGITTIELADGEAPYAKMNPSRILFQIVHNPPPTLEKITNWSNDLHDFIAECLEKNYENRPMMVEIITHPFLTDSIDQEDIRRKQLQDLLQLYPKSIGPRECDSYLDKILPEISIDGEFVRSFDNKPERFYEEDLAAIQDQLPVEKESIILNILRKRLKYTGSSYIFIGDILLSINCNQIVNNNDNYFNSNDVKDKFAKNDQININHLKSVEDSNNLENENYDEDLHLKYKFKSRIENEPHIYAVADAAFQNMLHHRQIQHILFSGESFSGKSFNVQRCIEHICYLADGNCGVIERVKNSLTILPILINAKTPINKNSTRCCLQYELIFGRTGRMSGINYQLFMLDKGRVSTKNLKQNNFNIFYYFYNYLNEKNLLEQYYLQKDYEYRYLRQNSTIKQSNNKEIKGNIRKYEEFEELLKKLEFNDKTINTVRRMLAAILNLGNLRFCKTSKTCRDAEFENPAMVEQIAKLLQVDERKLRWSLLNFITIRSGNAEFHRYSSTEARNSRDATAAAMYSRLVDWIILRINRSMYFSRKLFGEYYSIVVYDMYGFECFPYNGLEQLMINSLNEQMQYIYNQWIFVNNIIELENNDLPAMNVSFFDNKVILDNLLAKPEGLFCIIDEATRVCQDQSLIIDYVSRKCSQYIKQHSDSEISVAHYTGRVIYDTSLFTDINQDFVPPEIIETFRSSQDSHIKLMFTNQLTKCGNLILEEGCQNSEPKTLLLNVASKGLTSQINNLRSLSTNFRFFCSYLMKLLQPDADVGVHFVRCVRGNLDYKSKNFQPDIVQQQLRAMGILETISQRQQGYSYSINFAEFLERYKFLAFDFNENVEATRENCCLLLLRLKMEGWTVGKSKVFLRYYNVEYLAHLYETEIRKVIKIQAMARSLLIRKRSQAPPESIEEVSENLNMIQTNAATTIQKVFRKHLQNGQRYLPLIDQKTGRLNQDTAKFLQLYVKRWRTKSIFQVLLHYRAARFQDLVNLSQQVHIFNQKIVVGLNKCTRAVPIDRINTSEVHSSQLGPMPVPLRKLRIHYDQLPYYDTQYMIKPLNVQARQPIVKTQLNLILEENSMWDSHLNGIEIQYNDKMFRKEQATQTNWERIMESDNICQKSYHRDPQLFKRQSLQESTYNDNLKDNDTEINTSLVTFNSNSLATKSNPKTTYLIPSATIKKSQQTTENTKINELKDKKIVHKNLSKFDNKDNPLKELQNLTKKLDLQEIEKNESNDDQDKPPYNFKALLRKTPYNQVEKSKINNNENTYQFQINDTKKQYNIKTKSADINENDQNTEKCLYKDDKLENNLISSVSKIEEQIIPPEHLKTALETLDNNKDNDFLCQTLQNNYLEAEIEPGLLLSGHLVEI